MAALASFLNIDTFDVNDEHSKMRIPVTPAAVPTGYDTYTNAVLATIFGTGLPGIAGVSRASIEIDLGITPIAVIGSQDVRMKWQATMSTATGNSVRFSIPGRNPIAALITPGSKILASIGSNPWPAVLAALIASSGAVHMVDGNTGNNITTWGPVVSVTRNRKRPRVGGTR